MCTIETNDISKSGRSQRRERRERRMLCDCVCAEIDEERVDVVECSLCSLVKLIFSHVCFLIFFLFVSILDFFSFFPGSFVLPIFYSCAKIRLGSKIILFLLIVVCFLIYSRICFPLLVLAPFQTGSFSFPPNLQIIGSLFCVSLHK